MLVVVVAAVVVVAIGTVCLTERLFVSNYERLLGIGRGVRHAEFLSS